MRTFVSCALLLVVSCTAKPVASTVSGDLDVQLSIEPDPPSTGENTLHLLVRDSSGKPVDGAKIELEAVMAAMGSMPEMKAKGEVKASGAGRYAIAYGLSMHGDWALVLGIDAQNHPHTELRLKVSPPRKGFTLEGKAAGPTGIQVPPERQQMIGVTFGTVEKRQLSIRLRAAGRVEIDERKLVDVTLKYEAYAQKLFVGETGKPVKEGQPLLTVYSPELLAAEAELLSALKAGGDGLAEAIARRLASWDLTHDQVAQLTKRGEADGKVTIFAPAGGVVLEKSVVEGARVMAGTTLYRIGNLGRVWVQTSVSERDAAMISVGQPATVWVPSLKGDPAPAVVTFVAPTVDEKTRTLLVRVELVNPLLLLKPGMFADVVIEVPVGNVLSVPDSALLLSGNHRYAFVDRSDGRLEPVEVRVGAAAGEYDEVAQGLAEGDRVVIGAAFLLSSEAKLRDALPRWSSP